MGVLVILGQFFLGLGVLFIGFAAIWYVAIRSEKED